MRCAVTLLLAWLAGVPRPQRIRWRCTGWPATLNDGAGKLTDYATLQEAVLAWHALPSELKIRATVKMIGGPVYTAHPIDRLHYGPKPPDQARRTEAGE